MLKIRLRRMGARNRAHFRVVVSDSRNTPKASPVEEIGHYDPVQEPAIINIDRERVDYWVGQGAKLSNSVRTLLRKVSPQSEDTEDAEEATPQATPEPEAAEEAESAASA